MFSSWIPKSKALDLFAVTAKVLWKKSLPQTSLYDDNVSSVPKDFEDITKASSSCILRLEYSSGSLPVMKIISKSQL